MPLARIQASIVTHLRDLNRLSDEQADMIINSPEERSGDAVENLLKSDYGITEFQLLVAKSRAFNIAPFNARNYRIDERTFDLDLQNNETGAPGPDGAIDSSGAFFINLQNLLVARDNLRQGQVDLSTLALNVPFMDVDGDSVSDFDGSNINFVGLSLGSIVGTGFLSVEPTVDNAVLSVPGGGIANLLAASPTFGPVIRAGLQDAGVEPDSPDFFQFLGAAQTVVDSADPINWSAVAAADNSILLHEVIGDQVVPNAVAGAPLSGTEPMIRAMGLETIDSTVQNAAGIRGAVRFIQGSHGSLLDPSASPATTAEMQGQAASLIASGGTSVVVNDPSVIQTD